MKIVKRYNYDRDDEVYNFGNGDYIGAEVKIQILLLNENWNSIITLNDIQLKSGNLIHVEMVKHFFKFGILECENCCYQLIEFEA